MHCLSVIGLAVVNSSRDVFKRRASDEIWEITTAPLADFVVKIGETDNGGSKRSRLWSPDSQDNDVNEAVALLLSMANGNSDLVDSRPVASGRYIRNILLDASTGVVKLPENTQDSLQHFSQTGSQRVPSGETDFAGMLNAQLVNHQAATPQGGSVADSNQLAICNILAASDWAIKGKRLKNSIPREQTRAVAYVYPPTHNTGNRLEYTKFMKRRVEVGSTNFQRSIRLGCMDWSSNTMATHKMLMYVAVLESFHNALLGGTPNVEKYVVMQNIGHRINDNVFAQSIVYEWNRRCIEPLRLWEAGDKQDVPPCGPTDETISGERLFRLSMWQFQEFARRLMEITSLYIQRSDELDRAEPGSARTYLDIHDRQLVELLMKLPSGTLPYHLSGALAGSIM